MEIKQKTEEEIKKRIEANLSTCPLCKGNSYPTPGKFNGNTIRVCESCQYPFSFSPDLWKSFRP